MRCSILLVATFVVYVSALDKNDLSPYSRSEKTAPVHSNRIGKHRRLKGSTSDTNYTADDTAAERVLNISPATSVLKKTPDVVKGLEKTPTKLASNPSFIKVLHTNPSYGKTMAKDPILVHTLEKNPALVKPFADPKFTKQFEALRKNEHVISSIKSSPSFLKRSESTQTKTAKIVLNPAKPTSFGWVDDEEGFIVAYSILIIMAFVIAAVGYSKMH